MHVDSNQNAAIPTDDTQIGLIFQLYKAFNVYSVFICVPSLICIDPVQIGPTEFFITF